MVKTLRIAAVLLGICSAAGFASAQLAQPTPTPAGQPGKDQPKTLADLPPNLRLGVRAAAVQTKIPISSTLVIVSDESAYVAAIAQWKPTLHFPVLIDDGSWPAQEAIARFVRAYRPKTVVRWSPNDAAKLPAASAERRSAIESALASAWGTPAGKRFEDQLKEIGLVPPGVVVMNERDPAWTAGLALAAGRGQPIVWAGVPNDPDNYCTPDAADALANQITAGCESLGYSWQDLGDQLDCVTLCMNCSVKVFIDKDSVPNRGFLALTDVIGRTKAPPAAGKIDYAQRWAWCGQIFGDSPRAAADAMSALFLTPSTAWLFDGYPDSPPWNSYDSTKAAQQLKTLGWNCVINDDGESGGTSLDDWRWQLCGGKVPQTRSEAPPRAMGLDQGFIAVNSKGEAGWFDLNPGTGKAADMPILRRPAMVYFVHSWSATAPRKRETIAARFIEHGAYAYCGSVHEPFLQGFVPTPAVAGRLAAGMPWGAATRFDDGSAWKIAVFGDPLITVRLPRTKVEAGVPLKDTHALTDELTEASKAAKEGTAGYARMMRALSLLGRDEDAARLARALLKDKPVAVTDDVAMNAAMSVFIEGDFATLVALLSRCTGKQARVPMLADLAWQALYPVGKAMTKDERDLLVASIRPDSAARDARELVAQVAQADGKKARDELIARARGMAVFDSDKKDLEAMFKEQP